MDYRNATYNRFGTIDCEINHPKFGWIPFTASPDDVEPLGQEIYARAVKSPVTAYVALPPPTGAEKPRDPIAELDALKSELTQLGVLTAARKA